ncbi:MAG TPA: AMP-binding protein [Terriglobales bacterium]|nr:AMP-binding protein [Terriglobales bacterium]
MRAIDYFDKGAEIAPTRIAVIDGDARYTYGEVHRITERIARALWGAGLRGERSAAIFSPNDARVLFCMLGIMRAGGVWVPINYRNAIAANAEYLSYVETEWLFYHSSFRDCIRELKERVPSLKGLVCLDSDEGDHPSLHTFMESGWSAESIEWGDPHGNRDRLVGLVPTGGTTGPAKGVRVTSLAWGAMTEMATHYWRCPEADAVCLNSAPLSHAAGVVAFTMCAIGATNVILPKFDAGEVLRSIGHYRATHLFLPPTALYHLLAHPDVRRFDYSSLRVFLLAGSPVSPHKLKQAVEIFGPCLCQCYGQTESPMLLTWMDAKTVAAAAAGDQPQRLGSCGRATSAVRLAIMNEEGRLLPRNEKGEIVARGTLVTAGYHKMPEATAEIRRYGWHHTGDVGYMDHDGYVYIVDRKKDMIITGGFNVYCAEVEAGIMALTQVHECAVIGVPHETWGEAVTAIVVLRCGASLTEDRIIAHCKESLGGVKAPKSVEFRAEIPKTPAGKIDRLALRRPYWAGLERQVH